MKRMIGGAIFALAAVFGVINATSTTAEAQWRNDRNGDGQYGRNDRDRDRQGRRDRNRNGRDDRYDRNGGYGRNGGSGNQVELNQGYQYGLNTGASDAQRRQNYSPQRSHYYRNASSQVFRQGFVRGYDQGYRQYARSGNGGYGNGGYGNGGYGNGDYNNNNELNRGYQQGIQTGASDGQRGQNYSPQRSRYYQNASTQAFREGFVRGYDEGFRQYSQNGSYRRSSGVGIGDILGGILGRP